MTNYLFKGKTYNGNWVKGNLLCTTNPKVMAINPIGEEKVVNIRSETLSRPAGLVDANGREIYENDIIKFGQFNLLVYYNDECFQWKASKLSDPTQCFQHYDDIHCKEWQDIDLGWIAAEFAITGKTTTEVIGNIFDAPKLMADYKTPKRIRETEFLF